MRDKHLLGMKKVNNSGQMQRRILIVDDEAYIASLLRMGLENLPNCEIMIATSGTEALYYLTRQAFDLLITDFQMPVMDGVALASGARQLYPYLPIIMITGASNQIPAKQVADIIIQHILDKPVKLAEVRNLIIEVLEKASLIDNEKIHPKPESVWGIKVNDETSRQTDRKNSYS